MMLHSLNYLRYFRYQIFNIYSTFLSAPLPKAAAAHAAGPPPAGPTIDDEPRGGAPVGPSIVVVSPRRLNPERLLSCAIKSRVTDELFTLLTLCSFSTFVVWLLLFELIKYDKSVITDLIPSLPQKRRIGYV